MKKEPTLVVMAAGMGSRYGGLKQVDKITDAGEIILDFSLYDAMMAGFDRVIFIIREEHRDIFREIVDERAGKFMTVEYAYQKLEDIPSGFTVPEGRVKPWGTSHAILSCRDMIHGPFAVINADDYYGPGGFIKVYDYLNSHEDGEKAAFCMAGYQLKNTITENGHVSRGVCEISPDSYLVEINERTKIMRREDGIAYEAHGDHWEHLDDDQVVSMNFWGFTKTMMDELEAGMNNFFTNVVPQNPEKAEYQLPTVVDKMIKEGKAEVKVLVAEDKWCGVTYKEDRESVKNTLQAKKDKGEYPEKLWDAPKSE